MPSVLTQRCEEAASLNFPELGQVQELPAGYAEADVDWTRCVVVTSHPPPPDVTQPAALLDAGNEEELESRHYVLSRKAAQQSELLKNLIADEDGSDGCVMDVPVQSTATALRYAVVFLEYHAKLTAPFEPITRPLLPDWQTSLNEFDRRMLASLVPEPERHLQCIDVACVANYLSIERLAEVTAAAIGHIMVSCSTDLDRLRRVFRMANDLSPADEQALKTLDAVWNLTPSQLQ